MVAVIRTSSSLRNCLNYNEQKIKTGHARCLEAGYYPMDAADMTFYQKLARLEKLTELNQRTRINSVHISLNFDPSEKLAEKLLKEIAAAYLDKIGFGGQPYLLYQHLDAGHPHIHLVTTNIKPDGKAISLHHLANNQSEKARKEIEISYNLVRAQDSGQRELFRLKPVSVERVLYGRVETKRAIGGVLNSVLKNYRFTSLPELNAVLALYNITADEGAEKSRMREHDGLVYRVLDAHGRKVGVPIKASAFFSKPTLKNIRERFAANDELRAPFRSRLRNAVDLALLQDVINIKGLQNVLQKQGIDLMIRQNADGVIDRLTYVDHVKKTVFNGSDLGEVYSARAILERYTNGIASEGKRNIAEAERGVQKRAAVSGLNTVSHQQDLSAQGGNNAGPGMVDMLLDAGEKVQAMDWQLKRKKKKKKRQRLSPG